MAEIKKLLGLTDEAWSRFHPDLLLVAIGQKKHSDIDPELLEFLGDRVLGLIASSYLFERSFGKGVPVKTIHDKFVGLTRNNTLFCQAQSMGWCRHARDFKDIKNCADNIEKILGVLYYHQIYELKNPSGFEVIKRWYMHRFNLGELYNRLPNHYNIMSVDGMLRCVPSREELVDVGGVTWLTPPSSIGRLAYRRNKDLYEVVYYRDRAAVDSETNASVEVATKILLERIENKYRIDTTCLDPESDDLNEWRDRDDGIRVGYYMDLYGDWIVKVVNRTTHPYILTRCVRVKSEDEANKLMNKIYGL